MFPRFFIFTVLLLLGFALGIGVAIRCDDCIALHIKAAAEHGATREEIGETLGVAIYMGAGPSVMYATTAQLMLRSPKKRL